MAIPTVQSLPDILAGLEPAYGATRNIYNTQKAGVAGQTASSKMALENTKVNEFRGINTAANERGLSYSGIPIAEQQRYLGEKYLPGLMNIDEKATERTDALSLALAQLEADKYKTGLSTQQKQQDTLNSYLEAERARQAEIFLQQEKMRFEASENSKNRAASSKTQAISPAELRMGAIAFLDDYRGADGKVSPETYKQAKAYWIDSGGNPAVFDRDFRGYVNESHAWDYGYGSAPKATRAPYYENKLSF